MAGLRSTPSVWRVGETIHRKSRAQSTLPTELLVHLEQEGFAAVPRYLGVDEQGREMLTFIHGEVPPAPQSYDDAQLAAAAGLLRRFHDATANFPGREGFEVICHHDFCPSNCVFQDGSPVAIIDFDTAAPGMRLHDLGWAVPTFLNLGHPDYGIAEQKRRLQLFAAAYGLAPSEVPELVVHITASLSHKANRAHHLGRDGLREWAVMCRDWFLTHLFESFVPTGRAPLRTTLPFPSANTVCDSEGVDPQWTRLMGF